MKKFLSLLKATTKGDIKIFRVKGEGKSKFGKIVLFGLLSFMMMFISFTYASMIGDPLHKLNLTYIMLTLFCLAIVMLNIMETIYKAQGIIFDAKDNNLLFSLPIKKSYILTVRIIKLLVFDYIFEILFLLPCFIRYAIYEVPSISFYLLSLLFMILLPFIPLVIGCIIGYLIKAFSSIFKNKKMIQTVISLIMFFVLYGVIFNLDGFVNNIAKHAESINDLISKIYLPIGLYIDLIQKFNILKLLELILISIIPFIIFVYIFQFKYDLIINNSKETGKKRKNKNIKIKYNSVISSLTKKELKTYFSIPSYVINTIIGPILSIVGAVFMIIKYDELVKMLTSEDFGMTLAQVKSFIPLMIIVMIMLLTAMTSITSSSISLEGKKLSLIKSLPINPYDLFLSKIYTSDILIIPFMLISSLILIVRFKIFNYYIIFILLTCIIMPHLTAEIGLLINLKYPKFDYNSEVEVVKQSIAVLISLMVCIIICIAPMFLYNYLTSLIGNVFTLIIYTIVFIVLTIIINNILKTYGVKKYNEF